ncbi:MAG TPA: hypothetical protein VF177_09050 [Anaerolineae bacterium]
MKRPRALTMFFVLLSAAVLMTVSLVAAGAMAAPGASHSWRDESPEARRLASISEETGLVAATTPVSEACAYDDTYDVYLCPEPEPTILSRSDPAARAQALALLRTTGLLLIPDSDNDRVMAFDAVTGDLVDPNFVPTDSVNLSTPINAILSPSGDSIFVSDQIEDVVQEYDLDGNYMGVFAPAGGVDNGILDNIRGIALRANGNLLVTVAMGANAFTVAEFDTAGNYLGNFVAKQAGDLISPFDAYMRAADWLVSDSARAAIRRYDRDSGAYIADFAPIDDFPEQITEAANGNVLVGNFLGTQEGVVEFTAAGAIVDVYDPPALGHHRGVYELPNGNILTTNDSGVYEIDRSGNVVETKISDVSARFIELAGADAGIEETQLYMPIVFYEE